MLREEIQEIFDGSIKRCFPELHDDFFLCSRLEGAGQQKYGDYIRDNNRGSRDAALFWIILEEGGDGVIDVSLVIYSGNSDVFSYPEDESVTDPLLADHLAFFGIDFSSLQKPPRFDFNDPKTPFFTSPRFLPPTKVEKCRIVDAIISHGCFLPDCSVKHSVVGIRSRLDEGVELKDTMMIGADYYQTDSAIAAMLASGRVPIGVGQNTKIMNCIIDKNAKIGKNVVIANKNNVEEADRSDEGFYIRSAAK
ncbi:glucose-1-phosphate adenylyltransferase large subunit [Tanacetum coccineum]|uniref:glucose-1-phosphate adenylyltransferase n=1 Tax=Tanacetum coccineum TaxID=301880 RepID=A0ABQ5G8F4_9ASTR